MQITFKFNLAKALQVMAYILRAGGDADKIKLMKLVYLADREHFIAHGVSITGDRQCAMRYGPVPSATLDALNGCKNTKKVFRHIHIDDHTVILREDPGQNLLSGAELKTLAAVAATHGRKSTTRLIRETHELPEYRAAYVDGASRPITYEKIAEYSNNPERFRLGRPVISAATAAAMPCPFPNDADL